MMDNDDYSTLPDYMSTGELAALFRSLLGKVGAKDRAKKKLRTMHALWELMPASRGENRRLRVGTDVPAVEVHIKRRLPAVHEDAEL